MDIINNEQLKFNFVYQPIVCPITNRNIAFEILTLFKTNTVDNESFFKNVNQEIIKLIMSAQVSDINKINCDKSILFTINCSSEVMSDDVFIVNVMKNLTKKVAFELTSMPTTYHEYNKLIKTASLIKKYGHQIWLDDFLSEEIPMYALGLLNWDIIKIDKSFIYKNIDNQSKMSSLIKDINNSGVRSFIFEGVETEYQHHSLLKYKGLHQGFFYSKPILSRSLIRVGG